MNRAELLALAERVEGGATGFSLHADIALALGWRRGQRVASWWAATPDVKPDDYPNLTLLPEWSTSIDAQAALPGRIVSVEYRVYDDGPSVWVAQARCPAWAEADTEPAARLSALLRAMAEDADA